MAVSELMKRITIRIKAALRPAAQKHKIGALDLPPELRIQIAELVIIPSSLEDCYMREGRPSQHFMKLHALTQVNCTMRQEMEDVFIKALEGKHLQMVAIGKLARETHHMILAYTVIAELHRAEKKELRRSIELSDQLARMVFAFAFGRGPYAMRMRREGRLIEFDGHRNLK